ncbi:MAG: sigma-54-dependent Fis family transcriptional regulator [Deltaproteobacteria bacterium]|nr:sigma-54-dependent Fis family transcriptional regulator [Deltaproteobacteria bacterium]
MTTIPVAMQRPQYFHLLWDEEIERLREILQALREREDEVLTRWYQLYTVHFGEAVTLSQREFSTLYGHDLQQTVTHLLQGDMERFVMDLRATGEQLVERGVPFREVISCLHLFEESCSVVFDEIPWSTGPSERISMLLTFDKLSHCRMMVLAETYFGTTQARTHTRTQALEQEVARLAPDVQARQHFHGIVGHCPAMRDVFQRISAAGMARGTVLVVGESGTGKELVARAIHEVSGGTAPFVPVNCSALPRELIESELFGYRRGAFSGATTEYQGLFRAAEGGCLFLDEVTEMAPDTQAKLLRVLQERAIRPVGSVREVPVKVRIIASTNRDPHEAVRQGRLREDLYYRLNVNTLVLPPLRERQEDIALLVEYFLTYFSERFGVPRRTMSPHALAVLMQHSWPGNIRELMNVIESTYTFARDPEISLSDLPSTFSRMSPTPRPMEVSPNTPPPLFIDAERDLIVRALNATSGNKLQAAKLLGISRKKLYAKIAKYQIVDAE